MSNNNIVDTAKSNQDIMEKAKKKLLPNLLLPNRNWQITKDKSQSSQNIFNQTNYSKKNNKTIKLQAKKFINSNNLNETHFSKTSGAGFKNKFNYKIKNYKASKNLYDSYYNNRTSNLINESYEKKDIEQILLMKIEEIKKELEKNENTFIYNQKIMQKKLEEKENEINILKNELVKEKNNKSKEYENILKENNNKYINDIKEYKKEIESLKNKNQELIEHNFEKEKNLQNLESQNRDNISKLNDINQKYNLLIQEKAKNIMDDDMKHYIDELNQRINQQQDDINTMNEEIIYLNQENRRLKFLTREIIQARNETEIFFLDALNEAKKDLYKLQKEKGKRGCFFPTLKNYYDINNPKVDIRELTPEMRERILRNLFEKINKGYVEKNFRELSNIMQADLSDNDIN